MSDARERIELLPRGYARRANPGPEGSGPLQTHEHAIAVAASGALLGASLLGARFPRLVAWPLTAVGVLFGALGLLRAVQSTISDRKSGAE